MTDKIHIPITSPRGVLLKTGGKFCDRDIEATPELEELTVTENGEYIPPKVGYSKVIVDVASSGEAVTDKYYVNFYDYEGTLLYSYSKDEVEALTELPPLPEHEGLICQGWNWSLEDIKAEGKETNVGAMYITDDGKTRLYIKLGEGRTSPMLGVGVDGTITVDWGDGSSTDILTGTSTDTATWTPTHNYPSAGEYVISLTVEGSMAFQGSPKGKIGSYTLRYSSVEDGRNYAYRNAVKKIEIGSGVTNIGAYAFYSCYSLTSITIPNSVTYIGNDAFYSCWNLTNVTIPNSVTNIANRMFYYCYGLTSVIIPDSAISIDSFVFNNCYSLTNVTIPNSVTSIGSSAFQGCDSLKNITIPDSITSIDSSAFYNCASFTSITIPGSVTSLGSSAFYYCYSLTSVIIPDSITSISSSAFSNCMSLTSVAIPNSVTSIGGGAFQNCYSVAFYDFSHHTVIPTLDATNAFSNIPADCIIRVPAALYDEWIAATNWSTYAAQIVAV